MKVKSTGLANANMDVYIKSINSVMEDGRQFLQIDMDVTRPRNWKVVAKIGRDDLLVLLRQVFAPSVIFTTIYMLARNKDSDRK